MTTIKLSQLETVLDDLAYPLSRDAAAAAVEDVTLRYADGEESLDDVIERTNDDAFDSMSDLEDAVYNVLPREAVGEPYQSEGEG